MHSRLFKNFFFTTTVIFVIGFTLLSAILSVVFVNYLVDDIHTGLNKNCLAVVEVFNNGKTNVSDLTDTINALASTSDAEIFVSDAKGVVKICSCESWQSNNSCEFCNTIIPRKVLEEIADNESYFENGDMNDFYGITRYFTSAAPLKNSENDIIAFVFSASPTSRITHFFKTVARMYLLAAIIPIVLIFFAEYALFNRLIRPLKQMSAAAKKMAKGDFSQRIPVVSDDEIGELSISFNNISNSMVQLESMRRSFIANVSHELRTPMTTIGGFIDGILDGTIDKGAQDHYLNIVSDEIKRLSRLVEAMLSLAKLESGEQKLKLQKVDILKITRNVVVSQEKRIEEKNIEIIGLDNSEVTAFADYDLIYQVIFNLVDNAIKFTNNNGKIYFLVEKNELGTHFSIKNTGSFINKDELRYIFDRFYKGDKSRSVNKTGTGLGLYICKIILGIHGGKISAKSTEGEYTEFSFSLNSSLEEKYGE